MILFILVIVATAITFDVLGVRTVRRQWELWWSLGDLRHAAGKWLAVHLMPATGAHSRESAVPARHVLLVRSELLSAPEEVAPAASPAGAPELAAAAEPEQPAEPQQEEHPDANASVHLWGQPVDAYARFLAACEENGVQWPAAEQPAVVYPTAFRSDKTGPLPAVTDQPREWVPGPRFDPVARAAELDRQAAERDRYFGRHAVRQPVHGEACEVTVDDAERQAAGWLA